MMRHFLLALALLWATTTVAASETDNSDHAAIVKLVSSYTRFVGERDRKGFESLLLDKEVPFSTVSANRPTADSEALKNYAGFDKGIFAGDYPYRQQFSNVKIEQVGPIAQVSLNFTVERLDGKNQVYAGWKILQLVKTNGTWKIASELWTFDLD